jgi:hypothetical protein
MIKSHVVFYTPIFYNFDDFIGLSKIIKKDSNVICITVDDTKDLQFNNKIIYVTIK